MRNTKANGFDNINRTGSYEHQGRKLISNNDSNI